MRTQAILHFDPREGWTIRTRQGVILFGPVWTGMVVERWAKENDLDLIREEAPA